MKNARYISVGILRPPNKIVNLLLLPSEKLTQLSQRICKLETSSKASESPLSLSPSAAPCSSQSPPQGSPCYPSSWTSFDNTEIDPPQKASHIALQQWQPHLKPGPVRTAPQQSYTPWTKAGFTCIAKDFPILRGFHWVSKTIWSPHWNISAWLLGFIATNTSACGRAYV